MESLVNFSAMGELWRRFWGAVAFYTILPVPPGAAVRQVAVWAPLIGLWLGSLLFLADGFLTPMPLLPRSGLVVTLGLVLTGGFHLDGVIDAADGWAVPDPERRLAVMRDSHTGAYGVMAGCLVIVLKIIALGSLPTARFWLLTGAMGWGRWGQVAAICLYPYLRPEGKGKIHHQEPLPWQWLPGLLLLLAWGGLWWKMTGQIAAPLALTGWGLGLALGVGGGCTGAWGGIRGTPTGRWWNGWKPCVGAP
ncbi:cobalamin synthase [Gloeomargarita lithophora Alchichica-D10]|uniref:Adenosylcobinamide-GDP ribazoletransferase n=1 Tax=Gloeomargarita lithophora Alchichica-D10 TaxID=1188229 RepID=A0A1J0AE56_9CYAN|nr:adenosylcobinamide-GDP ribazoletransferase [Gloeomargarita lithophora]APB34230.1 cobalamin synthase [Gloeomargarita lithophora Alchichica-D10]